MNKMKKYAFMFIAMFVIGQAGMFTAPILSASETMPEEFSSSEISSYDQYVVLDDEQYTLDESAYSELSEDEVKKIEEQLEFTNEEFDPEIYEEEDGVMVQDFKEARSTGVTRIKIYWWGVQVKLSKGVFKTLAGTSIAAGTTYIGATFSVGAGTAAAIAAGAYVAEAVVGRIKNGVQFKVNWSGYTWGISWQ